MIISLLFSFIGFLILYYFLNFYTAFLSILSLIVYSFVYTPLKKISSIAVFIGAFPGAFPPLIGWVAATNKFGIEPGILFLIQFIWEKLITKFTNLNKIEVHRDQSGEGSIYYGPKKNK